MPIDTRAHTPLIFAQAGLRPTFPSAVVHRPLHPSLTAPYTRGAAGSNWYKSHPVTTRRGLLAAPPAPHLPRRSNEPPPPRTAQKKSSKSSSSELAVSAGASAGASASPAASGRR